MKNVPKNVKCNCGHLSKEHYCGEGCCDECGCTWYYPNDKWILRKTIEKKERNAKL